MSAFLNKISIEVLFRVKNIGKLPICNCRIDRAPHIGKTSFVLCWRCTGVLTSFFALESLNVFEKIRILLNGDITDFFIILGSICLMIPMAIDGVRQYKFRIESTNPRRVVTGFLFGIGVYIAMNTIEYNFNFFMN